MFFRGIELSNVPLNSFFNFLLLYFQIGLFQLTTSSWHLSTFFHQCLSLYTNFFIFFPLWTVFLFISNISSLKVHTSSTGVYAFKLLVISWYFIQLLLGFVPVSLISFFVKRYLYLTRLVYNLSLTILWSCLFSMRLELRILEYLFLSAVFFLMKKLLQ